MNEAEYKALREAVELAQSLSKMVDNLQAENHRLRLVVALLRYKKPKEKAGRKNKFSNEDIQLLLEYEPKFKVRCKLERKTFTRKDYVWQILRKWSPNKNKYHLQSELKTAINNMIILEKKSQIKN